MEFSAEICKSTRSSLEMCSLFGRRVVDGDEQSIGASRAGNEDLSANDDLS